MKRLIRLQINKIKNAILKRDVYAKHGLGFLKYIKYKPLDAPLSSKEIETFEKLNNVSLPEDYKYFLMNIGNGVRLFVGTNPFQNGRVVFGIERPVCKRYNKMLQKDCIFDEPFDDRVTRKPTDLFDDCIDPVRIYNDIKCGKCPHFDLCPFAYGDSDDDRPYYSGLYPLTHAGCTYVYYLIVKGKHRGEVWMDNDGSAFVPMKSSFSEYLKWLAYTDCY